jgi:AbrB family looped-hinge helix DNA binding protein
VSFEVRRVQRLGASSLVVTIPKEWARRLGLEAGSRVYLVDEGDSIRVIPAIKGEGEPPEILAPPIPEAAGDVVVCVYLSGLTEARVRLRRQGASEALMSMKEKALDLLGVQVGEAEDGVAVVKVALDAERLDISHMLRGLARDAEGILDLLIRLVRARGRDINRRDLEVLEKDFLRNQHAIIRYLMTRQTGKGIVASNYYAALATGYLGFAVDLLDNLVKLVPASGFPLEDDEARLIEKLLESLRGLISLEARVLANPSFSRTGELLAGIESLKAEVSRKIGLLKSIWAAVIVSKLHDVLRVLNLSAYVTLCMAVMSSVLQGKH